MSNSTHEALAQQVDATAETIRQYVDALNGDSQAIAALAADYGYGVDADEYDVTDAIHEYPLEVVDERGREFAVVLSTGGPHVEVVADGPQSARLEGYWAGERVTRYGDYLSTFLDYFIDRDDD